MIHSERCVFNYCGGLLLCVCGTVIDERKLNEPSR